MYTDPANKENEQELATAAAKAAEDAWRFPQETSKKLTRTVGVYSGDLTPATTCRSATGVTRGEQLFHRPELYRPWRSSSQQRQAEAIVDREHEIEVVTKKGSELRAEVAALQRELQRAQQRLKTEKASVEEAKYKEIEKLKADNAEAKAQIEQMKQSHESQLKAVRSEHETEIKTFQHKIKSCQEASNEMSASFMKQINDVKLASAREVALVQQLSHARTAELQNELDAARDAIRRLQERTAAALTEMQQEMHRSEERCVFQMREQENRYSQLREQMQRDQQALEQQRDSLLAEMSTLRENNKTLSFDVRSADSRFKDWNVRVLSDLDHLCDYFATIVGEMERQTNDHQQPAAFDPHHNNNNNNDPNHNQDGTTGTIEGLMDQVASRIQLLGRLKQRHASANQLVLKRVRGLEGAVSTTQENYQRNVHERDLQLTRLHAEVGECKARQERLEKALEDSRVQTLAAEDLLSVTTFRLQFLCDDMNRSLLRQGAGPTPPRAKQLTFVVCMVQGAAVLWEKVPSAMQLAQCMCNDALRTKTAQYGGYEFATDGDSMMLAFHDPLSAVRFCIEAQQWLLLLNWPVDLAQHHDGQEVLETIQQQQQGTSTATAAEGQQSQQQQQQRYLFRGLRVGMAIHFGDADIDTTEIPIGRNETRVKYFGRTVSQLCHIAALVNGGQILATGAVWHLIKDKTEALSFPVVTDMGQHRVTTSQGAGRGDGAVQGSELIGLCQILPKELSGRRFGSEQQKDGSGGGGDGTPVHKGSGIPQQLSQMWRTLTAHHVTSLREHYMNLNSAAETLADEVLSVTNNLTSLGCKVQDAQCQGRVYSQADIIAHIAALDRLSARADVVKRDVGRLGTAQKDLAGCLKGVEDLVLTQSRQMMTEDEYKKRLQLVNDRSNEKIFEAGLQNEHKLQQMKNALAKSESMAAEMRRQMAARQPSGYQQQQTAMGAVGNVMPPTPTMSYGQYPQQQQQGILVTGAQNAQQQQQHQQGQQHSGRQSALNRTHPMNRSTGSAHNRSLVRSKLNDSIAKGNPRR